MEIKKSHKGLLHKDLGISADKPISMGAIMKALDSKDPKVRKRANFARNARKWSHK